MEDYDNIRAALTAAKNDHPGSRWNEPEHDPLAAFERIVTSLTPTKVAMYQRQEKSQS